jgi:hypothetical protein
MAVLSIKRRDLLDLLTAEVQRNPALCQNARRVFCSWVPSGIAVRPELKKIISGTEQWLPAR